MATALNQPVVRGSLPWFREMIALGAEQKWNEPKPVLVTPHIADQLLMLNEHNRRVKPGKLDQYKRAMRAGLWRGANGETLKFKQNGELGDGQHRLMSIRDEGLEVELCFMFGATEQDIRTIDQGTARTAADIDRLNGGEMSESCAAIARMLIAYEASGGSNIGLSSRISNAEVNDRLDYDQVIRDGARWALSHKAPGLPASAVGFCWYLLSHIHVDDAHTYLMQVCKGVGLTLKDPAATVREYMITRVSLGTKGRAKKIEALLRGWNAYREGRTFSKVVTNGTMPVLI